MKGLGEREYKKKKIIATANYSQQGTHPILTTTNVNLNDFGFLGFTLPLTPCHFHETKCYYQQNYLQ
jgi:hypothetical protein